MKKAKAMKKCEETGCENCKFRTHDRRSGFEEVTLKIPCWTNYLSRAKYLEMVRIAKRDYRDVYEVGDKVKGVAIVLDCKIPVTYTLIKKYPNHFLWKRQTTRSSWYESYPKNANPLAYKTSNGNCKDYIDIPK